jgi:hypothetical protein
MIINKTAESSTLLPAPLLMSVIVLTGTLYDLVFVAGGSDLALVDKSVYVVDLRVTEEDPLFVAEDVDPETTEELVYVAAEVVAEVVEDVITEPLVEVEVGVVVVTLVLDVGQKSIKMLASFFKNSKSFPEHFSSTQVFKDRREISFLKDER